MARLWTEGFEFGDLAFFDTVGSMTISTVTARTGIYSARTAAGTVAIKNLPTGISEFYFRVCMYAGNINSAVNKIIWQLTDTRAFNLRITGGLLTLVEGTIGTYTGTSPIAANTWIVVEVHHLIHDTTGILEVKVDGTTEILVTGDTKPNTSNQIASLRFTGETAVTYFDDLAFNDTTGSEDTSWCGAGKVITLSPDGNGDASQLVGSDSDSVDNYLLVDEIPASASDYVDGIIINDRDLYHVQSYTVSGSTTIQRLWTESRTLKTNSDTVGIALGIKPDGGSELFGPDTTIPGASPIRVVSSGYTVNPVDSQPWEASDITNLQIGIKTR